MGVRRIYGYPGDGIDSITTTLRKEIGTEEGEAGSHKVV
jgi:thiamine pyrophosphate-dependent acetolactate synthase large subunit-like protein